MRRTAEEEILAGWEADGVIEIVDDVDRDAFREMAEPYLREQLHARAGRGPGRHSVRGGRVAQRPVPESSTGTAAPDRRVIFGGRPSMSSEV